MQNSITKLKQTLTRAHASTFMHSVRVSHSLLMHLQETLPSLEAGYKCENAKSLGSRITRVPVESAELLENYTTE